MSVSTITGRPGGGVSFLKPRNLLLVGMSDKWESLVTFCPTVESKYLCRGKITVDSLSSIKIEIAPPRQRGEKQKRCAIPRLMRPAYAEKV